MKGVFLCFNLWFVAMVLYVSMDTFGLEAPTIINTGEALVPGTIGQVEFMFVRHFTGATLEESVTLCDTFLKAAPQVIRGSELQPLDIRTSPPVIISLAEKQTRATIWVRFSMAAFNIAKTGPQQFAALCDKLSGVAETIKSTLSQPNFIPLEKEVVESTAVSKATENAYLPAEAIAQAVKSNIFAVESVELLELVWEQQPVKQTGDVPQLVCRAKVRVTYALGTP